MSAIGEQFDIRVAHREFEIGSINDRVIKNVYNADLVIANLTTLNPNVMFELAMGYLFLAAREASDGKFDHYTCCAAEREGLKDFKERYSFRKNLSEISCKIRQ